MNMKILKTILIICFLTTIVFAKPVADFTFNPISGTAPITVNFDASSSIDAEFYSWEIGGIAKAAGPVFTFDFGPGEHEVTLITKDINAREEVIKTYLTGVYAGNIKKGDTLTVLNSRLIKPYYVWIEFVKE